MKEYALVNLVSLTRPASGYQLYCVRHIMQISHSYRHRGSYRLKIYYNNNQETRLCRQAWIHSSYLSSPVRDIFYFILWLNWFNEHIILLRHIADVPISWKLDKTCKVQNDMHKTHTHINISPDAFVQNNTKVSWRTSTPIINWKKFQVIWLLYLTTCMSIISYGKTYLIVHMRETAIIHHKYYQDICCLSYVLKYPKTYQTQSIIRRKQEVMFIEIWVNLISFPQFWFHC